MDWKFFLLVGFGGGVGSILRALVGYFFRGILPWPTLIVNLFGAFLIGICIKYWQQNSEQEFFRAFWILGVCGGFTTFSAFGIDAMNFLKSSQWFHGILYITLNIFGTFLAIFAGFRLYSIIKA